ncbi:AraC family transcriptional regulator [Sedimentitalea sp.]|uniref:helix-turn-helix transcriptional regulator n=1 Tax=Sedimentitalea sp. TaxID=2048915 RepID=UPI0032993134
MTKTIPLIRAANILPLVRWMEMNRFDPNTFLEEVDLGYWYALSPLDPVPALSAIRLLGALARDQGPQIGTRIVTEASIAELGFIGKAALGARTPAEALFRICHSIPLHSSHETMLIEEGEAQVTITEMLHMKIAVDDRHAVQVLLCALLQQLCKFTGMQPPLLSRINMVGHTRLGTRYLEEFFGCPVHEAKTPAVSVVIKTSVAHNPFRKVARDRLAQMASQQVPPLAENQSLKASVRAVIAAMLHGGEPTIERLSRAAGTSTRTLQRRLAQEGTSFSEELDRVRRKLALEHIGAEDVSLPDLAERLGYTAQSALSRAILRLTGQTPTQLIREGTH